MTALGRTLTPMTERRESKEMAITTRMPSLSTAKDTSWTVATLLAYCKVQYSGGLWGWKKKKRE